MPDTMRGNFPTISCSDCREIGNVYLKHWGPLVPPGTVGYFDEKCFEARRGDSRANRPPRPLGQRISAATTE